jgi:hypothetical protein
MAKTKEQVLAVAGLTQAQKDRAEAYFTLLERTGKPQVMNVNTNQEVKDYLNKMIENYQKRQAAKQRKAEREAAEADKIKTIKELIESGAAYGFSFDDIVNAINDAMKERKNAAIREQIAALQAQLID